MMDILISLIVIIISQHMHTLNYYVVYLKYFQILFVNYTPVKLWEGKELPMSKEKNQQS